MNKHFKSIVAMLTAVMMLVITCIPAMAAEVTSQENITMVEENLGENLGFKMFPVNIKSGSYVGTIEVRGRGKIIVANASYMNSSTIGRLNLKVVNKSDGNFKQISIAANGENVKTEYASYFTSGTYEVWVDYVQPKGDYEINLSFYKGT